jgi:hypothetical protein
MLGQGIVIVTFHSLKQQQVKEGETHIRGKE